MLPCLMFSSQSSQSPSSSPGFSPSVGLSVSAFSPLASGCHPERSDRRSRAARGRRFRPCRKGSASFLTLATRHSSPATNSFIIRTYEKSPSNPFRIRTSKTQHLKGDYVFDTEACYCRKTVGGEYLVGNLSGPADPVIMRVG